MKPRLFASVILITLISLALAACAGGAAATTQPVASASVDSAGGSIPSAGGPVTVPAAYAGKANPHSGDAAAAEAGKKIFQNNCSACHGDAGHGDGAGGATLNPKPANLAQSQATKPDAYLFWRISDGGSIAPFNSAMPSWKEMFTEDQRWQIITYLHTLK